MLSKTFEELALRTDSGCKHFINSFTFIHNFAKI